MARLAHGKDSLALCTVLLIIILYIIISSSYSHNEYTRQRLFFGSCVGILCGVCIKRKKEKIYEFLLFFVTVLIHLLFLLLCIYM